jgi:hypothetical protein
LNLLPGGHIEKGRTMNIYEQLHKRSLPFLKAYKTDLMAHDKDWIEVNPGVPFMHYTRAVGTHLISLNPPNSYPPAGRKVKYLFGVADREKILQDKLEVQDWFETSLRNSLKLILHCDGLILQKVTRSKAREIIEDYICFIRTEWKRQVEGGE